MADSKQDYILWHMVKHYTYINNIHLLNTYMFHIYQGFIQDFQFGGGGRIFSEIFPEVYNLAKILLALPVGTATVEKIV